MSEVTSSTEAVSTGDNAMNKFADWPTDPCAATVSVAVGAATVTFPAVQTSYDSAAHIWMCSGGATQTVADGVSVALGAESTGIYLFLYNSTGAPLTASAQMSGTTTPAAPPPPPPPSTPPGGRHH